MLLQIITIVFLIPAIGIAVYYNGLAVVALFNWKKTKSKRHYEQRTTFAILVPAHNEEKSITRTIKSCNELDYPENKYKVFVIADNCTDNTAFVSSKEGASVMERNDLDNKGKGYALEWAFQKVLPEDYDAFIVIDADCIIDKQALNVLDFHLNNGERALQINDSTSNPDEGPISYALAVGNFIENELFYSPKSMLGLNVMLRGTGMVLKRDVLDEVPWKVHSIVEDSDYSLQLIKNGIKVHFVEEVHVKSEFPANLTQLQVQRSRWASGNLSFSKTQSFKLMWEGLRRRKIFIADAGITLFVLSRPLVLLHLFIVTLMAIFSVLFFPGFLSTLNLSIALSTLLAQLLYFGIGTFLFGINTHRINLFMKVPSIIIKLILISLKGILKKQNESWERTPR